MLCVLQVIGEHFDQEERKGMSKFRNHKEPAVLLYLIVSLCVVFLLPHPLFSQFTLQYKQGIQQWKIQFPAAANHVPFLSMPTTVFPS